jgi:hypothetical protein
VRNAARVEAKATVNVIGFSGGASSRINNGVHINGHVLPSNVSTDTQVAEDDMPESFSGLVGSSGAAPSVQLPDHPSIAAHGSGAPPPARVASLPPSARQSPSSPSPEIRSMPRAPTANVDAGLRNAAKASGIDVNTLRGIASIESSENPASNRNRSTQYKGLFQLNQREFNQYGGGDIYNAGDNAMAAARKFAADRTWFKSRYGREPSDRELYMIHQQGRGFFTRGAMTNIRGNAYPGMRGPQTQASFEAGWGRELERREDAFRRAGTKPTITLK